LIDLFVSPLWRRVKNQDEFLQKLMRHTWVWGNKLLKKYAYNESRSYSALAEMQKQYALHQHPGKFTTALSTFQKSCPSPPPCGRMWNPTAEKDPIHLD
jgi:hypothetical protein